MDFPRTIVVFLLAAFVAGPGWAAFDSVTQAQGTKELSIERVTPQGEGVPAAVGAARQIVFQFNRPVVPLGNMARQESEIPVTIEPKVACEWRWLNTSALSCNLGEKQALSPATTYRIVVNPGIKAIDGATIAAPYQAQFTTERPHTVFTNFRTWRAPGFPEIRVTFNQPVTRSSVEAHVFFALDKGDRMSLKAEPDIEKRHAGPFWKLLDKRLLGLFRPVEKKPDDEVTFVGGEEARRIWVVSPTSELALDTTYALNEEPGLISPLGPEPGNATRNVVSFDTFPEFKFLGVACHDNAGQELLFEPDKQTPAAACNPLGSVGLRFSSPVTRSMVQHRLVFTPDLAGGRSDYDPWHIDEEDDDDSYDNALTTPHQRDHPYIVGLPSGLKAAREYHVEARSDGWWARLRDQVLAIFGKPAAAGMEDEFGRLLPERLDIRFATDHRAPNYELTYQKAVLESGVESEIPFYVDNLENYSFTYRALFADGGSKADSFRQNLPSVPDVQFAVPFGLRQMLHGGSGAVYGTLATSPHVPNRRRDPTLFAQVTPYNLHVKFGHFNSLVWATDWATGQGVAGARVSVYLDSYKALAGPQTSLAEAVTDQNGIALFAGTDNLDPLLQYSQYLSEDSRRLFVSVRKDNGLALLPLGYDNQINVYRASGEDVSMRAEKKYGHMHSWGTTAQGIYRAGDTVDYKIYVRQQDNVHFIAPPKGPYQLKIVDPMGKVVARQENVTLSDFGAFSGSFTAPKTGAVGWYVFKLSARFDGKKLPDENEAGTNEGRRDACRGEDCDDNDTNDNDTNEDDDSASNHAHADGLSFADEPLRVLVADFTPSPFKVTNSLNGERFGSGDSIDVDSQAKLHAGGPYANAPLRVTALLKNQTFTSKNPLARGFIFGGREDSEERQIYQTEGQVDGNGEQHVTFQPGEQHTPYGKLTVESSVRDERGKYVSSRTEAEYLGVKRFVGLRSNQWTYSTGKEIALDTLVTDEKGDPATGANFSVLIERREAKAARVKGAGNAYLTNYTYEWVKAAQCSFVSKAEPQPCRFIPDKAGDYRAAATVTDPDGHTHRTVLTLWVTGKDYVLWDNGDENGLDLLPEKTELKVGDTARYLVKNPYPGARALITVERYGVIDHFERTLEGSTPVIEFPVKPDYVPGFYLSVTVFSPRVEKPVPEVGEIDLGKPAFRMGYLAVPVDDPAKMMLITAKADKEVYRPRDQVTLSLHAEPKLQGLKEPAEITVAVLDDAVFDLIQSGKAYFDPYKGFYKLDGLDVRNYDLTTQLVGRQKFEKKGATPGGDGGASLAMRNDFRFVSYWNTGQVLDAAGNATVKFPVPDNLTSWHVLAIAVTPTDRMGLGEASFKVNRPTELRPVMPNQVMEGDRFTAGFSVMNRTDKPRQVTVDVAASSTLKAGSGTTASKTVTLAAYQREVVELPLTVGKVPEERDADGSIHFIAKGGDASDRDETEFDLPVKKWRSLETAATYGTTTEARITEPIAFPKEIHPDVGQVSAVLSPSVIGNLAGAFDYIRAYPYLCWEQRLTKGVMAAHYKKLKAYLPDSLKWDGADSLPQQMLDDAASFQSPSGGMAYFTPVDSHADPYLSAFTALSFNWLRADGYKIPDAVETKLQAYLQNLLKQDAMPTFYNSGMSSTVRAVALAALAEHGKVTLSDLERYRPHLSEMSLFGKTHYLMASIALKAPADATKKVADDILAHANQSGGKITFSETLDDSYLRMLSSPLRENCAVLSALTRYGETAEGEAYVGDLSMKLARSITQSRGNKDHWDNTQENLFCLNALVDYARVYETEKPAMEITAALDDKPMGKAAFHDLRDDAVTLSTPITPNDPGRSATLTIDRTGSGRLYYSARLQYAPSGALDQPVNAGIELHREYEVERGGKWVLLTSPLALKKGELVKVDLFASLPAARNFVVVDDAVPGGLEPVNRELATSSVTDADKGDFKRADQSWFFHFGDWSEYQENGWNFYHEELRHDAVRFYSDYLPAGNYHLSYTAQAIADGSFAILPLKAEEMYDPDVFGKTPAAQLQVAEPKP